MPSCFRRQVCLWILVEARYVNAAELPDRLPFIPKFIVPLILLFSVFFPLRLFGTMAVCRHARHSTKEIHILTPPLRDDDTPAAPFMDGGP